MFGLVYANERTVRPMSTTYDRAIQSSAYTWIVEFENNTCIWLGRVKTIVRIARCSFLSKRFVCVLAFVFERLFV